MFKRSFCLPSLRLEDMYVYCKHAVFETGSFTVDFWTKFDFTASKIRMNFERKHIFVRYQYNEVMFLHL